MLHVAQREVEQLRARLSEAQEDADRSKRESREAMRQLAGSEAARKEAEATAAALRSSGRKETRRLQTELEAVAARLRQTELSAEQAAEDVRRGETEAVAVLRETNSRLRERVRQLTQQLKSMGGRAYAQPVPRPGRVGRSSASSAGSRPSRASSRGSGRSGGVVGRSASVGSRGNSVGSSLGSRASSRASGARSGAGGAGARFDPTAYVQRRKQRLSERRAGRRLPRNDRIAGPAGTPNSGRSAASRVSAASSARDRPRVVGSSAHTGSGFATARVRPPRAGSGAAAVRVRPASATAKRAGRGTDAAAAPAHVVSGRIVGGGRHGGTGKSGAAARRSKTARGARGMGGGAAGALAAAVARGGSRGKIWERSPSAGSTGSRASSERRRGAGEGVTGTAARRAMGLSAANASGFSEAVPVDEQGRSMEPDALDLLGVSGAGIGTREAPGDMARRLGNSSAVRTPAIPPPLDRREAWGRDAGEVDAGSELTDIDSRLRALQSFLRQAKSSSSGTGPASAQRAPAAVY